MFFFFFENRNERGKVATDILQWCNHKGILWTVICQQIGQPRRIWLIPRCKQSSVTESGLPD